METTRDEGVLCNTTGDEWDDISRSYGYGMDYVALVFDDDASRWITDDLVSDMRMHERDVMSNSNSDATEEEQQQQDMKIIRMGVFACGCILPRLYFTLTDVRLHGHECVLLPSFVLDERDVVWIQQGFTGGADRTLATTGRRSVVAAGECNGKDAIVGSGARGTPLTYNKQLAEIKRALGSHGARVAGLRTRTRTRNDGDGGMVVEHQEPEDEVGQEDLGGG